MKDSHLAMAIIAFIVIIAYAIQATRKANKIELQESAARNQVDNLLTQKTDLEAENQKMKDILDRNLIWR